MDDLKNFDAALARLTELRSAHLENISSLLTPSARLFQERNGQYIEVTVSQLKVSRSTLYSIDRILELLSTAQTACRPDRLSAPPPA